MWRAALELKEVKDLNGQGMVQTCVMSTPTDRAMYTETTTVLQPVLA